MFPYILEVFGGVLSFIFLFSPLLLPGTRGDGNLIVRMIR